MLTNIKKILLYFTLGIVHSLSIPNMYNDNFMVFFSILGFVLYYHFLLKQKNIIQVIIYTLIYSYGYNLLTGGIGYITTLYQNYPMMFFQKLAITPPFYLILILVRFHLVAIGLSIYLLRKYVKCENIAYSAMILFLPLVELFIYQTRYSPMFIGVFSSEYVVYLSKNTSMLFVFALFYSISFLVYEFLFKRNSLKMLMIMLILLFTITNIGIYQEIKRSKDVKLDLVFMHPEYNQKKAKIRNLISMGMIHNVNTKNYKERLILIPENSFIVKDSKSVLQNEVYKKMIIENDVLLGIVHSKDSDNYSSLMLQGKNSDQEYRKTNRVLFGEYTPFFKNKDDLTEIKDYAQLEYKGLLINPLMCSEITDPYFLINMIPKKTNFMILSSNTVWLGKVDFESQNVMAKALSSSLKIPLVINTQNESSLIYDNGTKLFEIKESSSYAKEATLNIDSKKFSYTNILRDYILFAIFALASIIVVSLCLKPKK